MDLRFESAQLIDQQNIAMPNLMFSRIVPAFSASNIGELGATLSLLRLADSPLYLGPLILVALIYMLIGMTIAWVIKLSFWVPHRFRYGILAAGGWANIGDIRKLNEIAYQVYILST